MDIYGHILYIIIYICLYIFPANTMLHVTYMLVVISYSTM